MLPLNDCISLAHRLVDRAGEVIKPYFRSGLVALGKADGSPVTQADREAEAAIREILREVVPDHGVIGEELGVENSDAEFVWVLDPIDGTKAFVAGKPLFVTLVALLHRGQPILGVINQPITGERWFGATGQPTTFGGAPCVPRRCAAVADARVSTTGPQYFTEAGGRAFARVASRSALLSYGGDAYQYGLVAMGSLDLVVESGLKLHDWAALLPIVRGAGGVFTDWQGNPPTSDGPGDIVAAGDASCHADALKILANEPGAPGAR